MLPHYAHEFGASRPALGLLVPPIRRARFPARCRRLDRDARRRAQNGVVALLMFTVSIVPFGFATDIATLDALRFAQGAACGCIWGWRADLGGRGNITSERRSEVLGSVFGSGDLRDVAGTGRRDTRSRDLN